MQLNDMNIPSSYLSSELKVNDIKNIYGQLNTNHLGGIKMLYITPERVVSSQTFIKTLKSLNERKLLQRIVIDEAHCVSQWVIYSIIN
jgi:superfamily II DNA helicase RecQ